MTIKLAIEPLTRAAFSPFGDVIEMAGAQHYPINQGFAERFNDLASTQRLRAVRRSSACSAADHDRCRSKSVSLNDIRSAARLSIRCRNATG